MRILLLNQCFYPDVAATAQHAADLARELAMRGHQVTAIASRRPYGASGPGYPASETWEGVLVYRLWQSTLGKGSRWRRAADFASFYFAAAARLLRLPPFDVVIAMTTPPLISCLGAAFTGLRGGRLIVWLMDLNPDEAIAAGWLKEGSVVAGAMERALRWSLAAADHIVVLDHYMRQRILARGVAETKIPVLPPWSHDDSVRYDPEGRQRFRRQHNLEGKFVVMYSGNHSPCHPLDTLLGAARSLSRQPDVVFCFVGGGSQFPRVQQFAQKHDLPNILCLPYQPLDALSASLSAADLHVVIMGDPYVGIVHPCKIYNILRLGLPLLYIGPGRSHITDLLPSEALNEWAHVFRHGEVDAVAQRILECARSGPRRYAQPTHIAERFSRSVLLPRLIQLIEQGSLQREQAPAIAAVST